MKPLYRQPNLPFPDFPTMEPEPLQETAADFLAEAQLDRETHIVRNVALLGPESRNGYRYTSEAMQEAVALYDGRPVFIDHAESAVAASFQLAGLGQVKNLPPPLIADSRQPISRSLRDYAGKVVNPRYEGERIRGDLHLIGPNAEWLLSLFEASPSDIGMSHVVLARRNHAGDEVEKIEKVVSVDIVAFPATVQSFWEGGPLAPRVDHQLAERVDHTDAETPRSAERDTRGAYAPGSPALRRALIAAIRGE
jgi:hypothetical protein